MIGTCLVKGENELHVLDFNEEDFELTSTIYRHPFEVWSIIPHPSIENLIFTIHCNANESGITQKATLWKLELFEDKKNVLPLKDITSIDMENGVKSIVWDPLSSPTDARIVSLDDSCIKLWKLSNSLSNATVYL